ncbi:MAG: sulfotransferase domain-containing protein [Acidobacteriota bacterium]
MLKRSARVLTGMALGLDLYRLTNLDFFPRPEDIFIVAYPRSGTTWMQMILYQLTTNGEMNFSHISEVSPWFERSSFNGRDLEALPSPRILKSHLPWKWIPRGGCKYIYVARDGRDVAVSLFHFLRTHAGYRLTFSRFFDRFMRGRVPYGSWFKHVAGWWEHRGDSNVLCLKYEDLVSDLDSCVQRVIEFCRLDVAPERLPSILERCRFAFMKRHEAKFDHLTELLWERGAALNNFFRKGQVGDWTEQFDVHQIAAFEQEFLSRLGKLGIDFSTAATKRAAQTAN